MGGFESDPGLGKERTLDAYAVFRDRARLMDLANPVPAFPGRDGGLTVVREGNAETVSAREGVEVREIRTANRHATPNLLLEKWSRSLVPLMEVGKRENSSLPLL